MSALMHQPCTECGADVASLELVELCDGIVAAAGSMGALLLAAPAAVAGQAAEPGSWSSLEYAAHLRDVLLSCRERMVAAAIEDHPLGQAIHRDERIALGLDASATPDQLSIELETAAQLLARTAQQLGDELLARPLTYSAVTPIDVDGDWVLRQGLHEAVHHLADVRRLLEV